MTDERAVELANLLAEYVAASEQEGASTDEALGWTVGETLQDIVSTTPQYLTHTLTANAKELGA